MNFDTFPLESCKNMQKRHSEPLFSKLLYEKTLHTTSLHWLEFSIQGKVKVTDLLLICAQTEFYDSTTEFT